MFNNDGSEGKMCGNASYCIGTYVYNHRLTDKTTVTLETLSGIKTLNLSVKDGVVESVTVDMGKASIIADNQEITISNGVTYKGTAVSMGNPHFVIFTETEISEEDFQRDGKLIEHHEFFPERTNVEFVTVLGQKSGTVPDELKMRVWERGTGETLACGTGACATAVAAVIKDFCDYGEEINVKLKGGVLYIMYNKDGNVTLRGHGVEVFSGEVEI
jgi:diaminopimelate epimerase